MITIAIIIKNEINYIQECIEKVFSLISGKEYEVIIIDGLSTDGTYDLLQELNKRYNFKLIRQIEGNRSLPEGKNIAIKIAKGNILGLIDGDAYPSLDWLKNIEEEFKRNDIKLAGLGGPNYGIDTDNFIARCNDVAVGSKLVTGKSRFGKSYNNTIEIDHNPSCNAFYNLDIIRKENLRFNEYLMSGDDLLFDYQLKEKGYNILYKPSVSIYHHRRPTLRKVFKQTYIYGKSRAEINNVYLDLDKLIHYIPSIFIILSPILLIMPIALSIAILLSYWGLCLYGTFNTTMPNHTFLEKFCASFMIPIMHIAWGLGYLRGKLEIL